MSPSAAVTGRPFLLVESNEGTKHHIILKAGLRGSTGVFKQGRSAFRVNMKIEENSQDSLDMNPLRAARDAALMTRAQLSLRCSSLAQDDPTRYTSVSVNAIRDLEVGRTKPRRSTAATLSAALQKTINELFPQGLDTPLRNPQGHTSIAPDRPRGGRPRKSEKTQ